MMTARRLRLTKAPPVRLIVIKCHTAYRRVMTVTTEYFDFKQSIAQVKLDLSLRSLSAGSPPSRSASGCGRT